MGENSMENMDHSSGGADLKSVKEMTSKEIEAELKEKGISQPGRWIFYKPEAKGNFLEKVRKREITAEAQGKKGKHESPYDQPGTREIFRNRSKADETKNKVQ